MSRHDDANRRRAGRDVVAQRTIWHITIGAFQARCLYKAQGRFIVQARIAGRWTEPSTFHGADPHALLEAVVASKAIEKSVKTASAVVSAIEKGPTKQ